MKKNKFFTAILLALLFVCPLSTHAIQMYFFNGEQCQGDTLRKGVESGTVLFDWNTGTYTLDNAVIKSETWTAIFYDGNYGSEITIKVKGTCSVSASGECWGISSGKSVKIMGSSLNDVLNFTCGSGRLVSAQGIVVSNCTLNATAQGRCFNVRDDAIVSFNNCKATLESRNGEVIEGLSGITFDGCRIYSPDPSTIGIIGNCYRKLDGSKFFSMTIDKVKLTDIIAFEDDAVKALCVKNWDTNKDGALSYGEAAAVTSLGEVFKENTSIKKFDELQYFTGLTSIGENAFRYCSNLEKVTIPRNVVTIEDYAFYLNGRLSALNFMSENSLESIKNYAFTNASFKTVNNLDKLTYIGECAFKYCRSLQTFDMPSSLAYIGNSAFFNCAKYNTVIPSSVVNIQAEAFSHCSSLDKDQTIGDPNYKLTIGKDAFLSCPLHKIVINCDIIFTSLISDCFFGDNADDFICYVDNHTYDCFQNMEWTAEQKWRVLPYVNLGNRNMAPIYCNTDLVPAKSDYWGPVFRIVSGYEKSGSYVKVLYTAVPQSVALPAGTPALVYTHGADRVFFKHPAAQARNLKVKNLLKGSYTDAYAPGNTDKESYYLWNHTDDNFKCLSSNYRSNKVLSGCAYLEIPVVLDASATPTISVGGTNPEYHIYSGDVNGDGQVDVSDLNLINNVILGLVEKSMYPDSDVNGDGSVDVSDCNIVINIILDR